MSHRNLRLVQALMAAGMVSAAIAAPQPASRTYIVQLAGAPLANYTGGVKGLAATAAAEGEKLNAHSSASKAYRAQLHADQQTLLASVGGGKAIYQYSNVFNGFAAKLTEAQVRKLQATGKVISITPDEVRHTTTLTTSHFLGLDAPGGLWSQVIKRKADKGENVIVAVVDSGIQPENPAFYDRVDTSGTPVATGGNQVYGPPPAGWMGSCVVTTDFPASACNNKLIGAKVFSEGFLASGAPAFFGTFFNSPRDEGGHGTHTLSTIGGNSNSPAKTADGIDIGRTSGIAPRARLATYKALFGVIDSTGALSGSGYNTDLVAAIDQAVADGVDVINYSVSGSKTNVMDPVEVSFLFASQAGVFVAASAGNSGPGNQVAHPSPWITTVGASTHDRSFVADLNLGDGSTFTGPSFTPNALPNAPMVLSSTIAAAGATTSQANLCFLNSLDATKAVGKIVVCDRGTNARVEKSAEVKRAGGVGMVMINPSANSLVADFHSVPTVHLQNTARTAVRSYVAGTDPSGAISSRYQASGVVAPVMASFSSRGPNLADSSVMKPDITAPGVDVIASVAYIQKSVTEHDAMVAGTLIPGPVVDSYQGTSMSSPHIAGVAALLKQAHPRWSPAAIKSAIMTTATGVRLADGKPDTDPNGYGAGHVNPNGATDPGLVFDAGFNEYIQFLCGGGWLSAGSSTCATFGSIVPTNLNLPSVSADIPGTLTVKRKVTNVGSAAATYTPTANVPGFDVSFSPASLTVAAGRSGTYSMKITTNGAASNTPVFGSTTWSDGTHNVTSPVRLVARDLLAPGFVSSTAATGSQSIALSYGFTGPTNTVVSRLVPATGMAGTVGIEPTGALSACLSGGAGTQLFKLTAPADALAVRAELHNEDTSGAGMDDLDLALFDSAGNLWSYSGSGSSDETVGVTTPPAGDYYACVIGYNPAGGSSNFTLSTWVVTPTSAGAKMRTRGLPSSVVTAQAAKVTASWSGLVTGTRYLGGLHYYKGTDTSTSIGATLVSVQPGAAAITAGANSPTAAKQAAMNAR